MCDGFYFNRLLEGLIFYLVAEIFYFKQYS